MQAIAAQVCSVHEGCVQTALVEAKSEHDNGRLSNNLLVHFKGSSE